MVFVGRKAKPISIFAYPCNNLSWEAIYAMCHHALALALYHQHYSLTFSTIFVCTTYISTLMLWGFRWRWPPSHQNLTASLYLSPWSCDQNKLSFNWTEPESNQQRGRWLRLAGGDFTHSASDPAQRWNPVISEHAANCPWWIMDVAWHSDISSLLVLDLGVQDGRGRKCILILSKNKIRKIY